MNKRGVTVGGSDALQRPLFDYRPSSGYPNSFFDTFFGGEHGMCGGHGASKESAEWVVEEESTHAQGIR